MNSPRNRRHQPVIFVVVCALICGGLVITARQLFRVDASTALERAQAAAERGETALAQRMFDEILKSEPANAQALLFRGQLARDADDVKLARELWRRVPDGEPGDARQRKFGGTARYLEATLMLEQGNARDGEQLLLQSRRLNPDYPRSLERLVELYVAQLRTRDVRLQLRQIRRLREWTLDELVLYELISDRVTEVAKGVEMMSRFVAADPDDVQSAVALARYYMADRRHRAADQVLSALLKRQPGDSRIAGVLAESRLNQHDREGAWAALRVVELDQADPGEHYWRGAGRYWMEVGDWKRAAECLERLVDLAPNELSARHRVGDALQRMRRRELAQTHLDRAALIDKMRRQADRVPNGQKSSQLLLPIMDEVVSLLARMERFEEAVWWLEQAVKLEPTPQRQRGLEQAVAVWRQRGQPRAHPFAETSQEPPPAPASLMAAPAVAGKGLHLRGMPDKPPADSGIRLRDVHSEVGLEFTYFNGQTGLKYLVESMGGGVVVLDYDMDGWPDLYLTQGCPLPVNDDNRVHRDRLFRNTGEGRFEDVTEAAGLGDHRYGQGCAAGDYDNDGDPDLMVANFGRNVFYLNNGDGTFSDITGELGMGDEKWSSAVTFADFDRDGNLDIYLANYVDSLRVCHSDDGKVATCDPHNFGGEQDRLYWNRGDGTFLDVTTRCGIVAKDGKGLGISVADFNDDGRPDIYVANDGTPNFLFRNESSVENGLRFKDVARSAGVAVSGDGQAEAGMGVACADLNYDGRLDLYVTNFHLETNTLYLNLGDFLFMDATRLVGLADPTLPVLGFGTQALDLDRDGRWEVLVANGHIDDLRHKGDPFQMSPQLFRENGAGRFADISTSAGPYFQGKYLGRGVARLDWDRDGDTDVIVVHQQHPTALLSNESSRLGDYLDLRLIGRVSNRDAVGARILIETGGRLKTFEMTAGDGFFSQNERRLIIGLGDQPADLLRVRWPSGVIDQWLNPPSNREITLMEGKLAIEQPDVTPQVGEY